MLWLQRELDDFAIAGGTQHVSPLLVVRPADNVNPTLHHPLAVRVIWHRPHQELWPLDQAEPQQERSQEFSEG
jgi:hypothetical protein